MPASQMEGIALEYANILGVRMPLPTTGYEEMISAPADIATWMQFESLVSILSLITESFSLTDQNFRTSQASLV